MTLLFAVVLGVGGAYGVRAVRNASNQQATSNPTPTAESPSPVYPSPSPVEISPSPVPSESPSPTQAPAPQATKTPVAAGPAAYPAEIKAGTTYHYGGSGQFAALASDRRDSGTSICAGINTTSQAIADKYLASYFVSVTFSDGNILSAGYVRQGTTSNDFAQIQKGSTKTGNRANAPTTGASHTYCVTRSGSSWKMTSDGAELFSTTSEAASSTAGAVLRFESSIQDNGSPSPVSTDFVVPGFHDIAIDGKPPTQLTGAHGPF